MIGGTRCAVFMCSKLIASVWDIYSFSDYKVLRILLLNEKYEFILFCTWNLVMY